MADVSASFPNEYHHNLHFFTPTRAPSVNKIENKKVPKPKICVYKLKCARMPGYMREVIRQPDLYKEHLFCFICQ